MNAFLKALAAGAAGAVTTTVLHQILRAGMPNAPRVDLLGMQALAKTLESASIQPPTGRTLYNLTLAGDLVSNAGYFALAGAAGSDALVTGAVLGIAAGLGAAYLPPYLGLSEITVGRTGATRAATVALYAAGGLTAGTVYRALRDEQI